MFGYSEFQTVHTVPTEAELSAMLRDHMLAGKVDVAWFYRDDGMYQNVKVIGPARGGSCHTGHLCLKCC